MRTIRLLLVDDSPEFLTAIAGLLEIQPEIEIIGSVLTGREAIEQVLLKHPDVVLLDLIMPEMDGLEVTRRLKAETNPPRVIIATLEEPSCFQEAATSHGADGFISKSAVAT